MGGIICRWCNCLIEWVWLTFCSCQLFAAGKMGLKIKRHKNNKMLYRRIQNDWNSQIDKVGSLHNKRFINEPTGFQKTNWDEKPQGNFTRAMTNCLTPAATIFMICNPPRVCRSTRWSDAKVRIGKAPASLSERHNLTLRKAQQVLTDWLFTGFMYRRDEGVNLDGPDRWVCAWIIHGWHRPPIWVRRQQGRGGIMGVGWHYQR